MARPPSTKNRRRGWAWTLTIIAALIAVVWVGSMKVDAGWLMTPTFLVGLCGGAFGIATTEHPTGFPTGMRPMHGIETQPDWNMTYWFGWWRARGIAMHYARWIVVIPLWPFVLLTGVPGVWMLVKTRRHTNPNACPACGYDRTGLPQSSTGPAPCPECGMECGWGDGIRDS